jgi:putative transposase
LPDGENAVMKNTGMNYDPDKHHRQSIRLKHYDYSQAGAYFITIVTQNRQHLFGRIENGVMNQNLAGMMVETIWYDLPERFPHIALDAFVVMPNHVHGIIVINPQPNNKTSFTSNDTITAQTILGKSMQTDNHTIITLNDTAGAGLVPAPTPATNQTTLGKTKQMNDEMAFVSNPSVGIPTRGIPTRTGNKTTPITNESIAQTDTPTPMITNANDDIKKRPTLGDVVGAFKSLTTHAYILGVRENNGRPFEKRLWQRNYYERIVRNDDAMTNIRAYIETNPKRWENDTENVANETSRAKR